jgi:phosphatidylglycerol:prolipoprotein diacylglycerol transferase
LALQFPDFDPIAAQVPAFPLSWAGQTGPLVAFALVAVAAIGAIVWHSRTAPAAPAGDASDAENDASPNRASALLWDAVQLVAGIGIVGVVLHFAVGMFHFDVVGPFPIRWYALAYIAGLTLGWFYCVRLVQNPKLWGERAPTMTSQQIGDLFFWITFAVILGGRIGYICFYMLVNDHQRAELFASPLELFEIWKGGMSFHGALIGVSVAMIAFALSRRIVLLGIADLVAACEPIGQCFGRLANFINGELWGRQTHVPWGMIFCNKHIAQENGGACPDEVLMPRHPSQLYEAALEGVLLFLVLRFATHRLKWLQRPGAVTGLWLIGYGAIRIALETVRNPDDGMPDFPLGLTMGMILSVPMILVGGGLLWWAFRGPKTAPPPSAPAAA